MKVNGIDGIQRAFRGLSKSAFGAGATKTNPQVIVGYTAEYAVYVHENLECNHPNGGQAKYLESPARRLRPELVEMVRDLVFNKKMTLANALLLAGLRLQRESQLLVPIDTGNLRDSAFTRLK